MIVSAGGAGRPPLVAYDAASGARVWAAGDGGASYSSPTLLTLAGRPQVVVLNHRSVAGHDPATGAAALGAPVPARAAERRRCRCCSARTGCWSRPATASAARPIASQRERRRRCRRPWCGRARASSRSSRTWSSTTASSTGSTTACSPASIRRRGERRWKGGRYGHGQLLLVGGLLLVQTEEGELVLVEPSPEAYRELTRFAALDGKTWNPPALAGSLLLVRNDREAAAYELPRRVSAGSAALHVEALPVAAPRASRRGDGDPVLVGRDRGAERRRASRWSRPRRGRLAPARGVPGSRPSRRPTRRRRRRRSSQHAVRRRGSTPSAPRQRSSPAIVGARFGAAAAEGVGDGRTGGGGAYGRHPRPRRRRGPTPGRRGRGSPGDTLIASDDTRANAPSDGRRASGSRSPSSTRAITSNGRPGIADRSRSRASRTRCP